MNDDKSTSERRCSFCGLPEVEVESLVMSPNQSATICGECIRACHEILKEYSDLVDSEKSLRVQSLP